MSYIDGFRIAVPKANKEKFVQHAETADSVFMEWGSTRALECWEGDVRDVKVTGVRQSVQAKEDEAVVFAWIEWPAKARCEAVMEKMMKGMDSDPRLDPKKNPMPFDGKRMIFGGFAPVVTLEK